MPSASTTLCSSEESLQSCAGVSGQYAAVPAVAGAVVAAAAATVVAVAVDVDAGTRARCAGCISLIE